jgi:phosphatidylglycerol lysyltransferase
MLAAGPVSYPRFLSGFLLAQIITQVSPLPGGIGVFEAVILLLRPPGVSAPLATGALLLYRVGYYLLPLLAAGGILAWQASRGDTEIGESARRLAKGLAPHLFAVLTFLSGVFLLLFGALPAGPGELTWLGRIMPTAVIEGSRFLGSLVGVGMILLAWGLERRIWGAYRLTVGLLVLGIAGALIRWDYMSAALLLLLLTVLYGGRRAFNRRTALSGEPLDAGWGLAVILGLAGVAWLVEFSIHHLADSSDPFWRFAIKESEPKALRMAVAGLVALVIFVGIRLLAHTRHRLHGAPAMTERKTDADVHRGRKDGEWKLGK